MSLLTGSGILLNLLGFCYRIFLSRMMGADGMGVYQLVLPFYSVLQALTLSGLTVATSSLAAEEYAKGSLYGAQRVLSRAKRAFFLLFFPIAALTLLGADFISTTLLGSADCRTAVLLLLPCLLLTGVENLTKNYFYGIGKTRPPITSELTEQVVRFLAVAVFLFCLRPKTPSSAVACVVLGMVTSEVVSVLLLTRFRRALRPAQSPVHTTRSALISLTVPLMISALAGNLLSSATAVLLPNRLVVYGHTPQAALSEYGVLFGMVLPLLSLPFALLGGLPAVLIPLLTEGTSLARPQDVRRKAGKALHITGLLSFPVLALSLPLTPPLLDLLYQQTIAEASLLPLSLATFFGFYQFTSAAILNGIGKTRRAAIHSLIGGAIQLIFTWAVGSFGLSAFLLGDVVGTAAVAWLNLACLRKTLAIKPPLHNWIGIPALSACLAFLFTRVTLLALVRDGVPLAWLIAALIGGTVYLAALRIQGTSLIRYLKPLQARSAPCTPHSPRGGC